jgi:hypothetical protein
LDDEKDAPLADDEKAKQSWTVKKLPIKGGNVLRSAMLTRDDRHNPEWVQIEGQIEG